MMKKIAAGFGFIILFLSLVMEVEGAMAGNCSECKKVFNYINTYSILNGLYSVFKTSSFLGKGFFFSLSTI